MISVLASLFGMSARTFCDVTRHHGTGGFAGLHYFSFFFLRLLR